MQRKTYQRLFQRKEWMTMSEEIEKRDEVEWIHEERSPGEIVVSKRKKLGWSQEELEWRTGISLSQIYRIENNRNKASVSSVERLEKALGIHLKGAMEDYWKDMGPLQPGPRPFPGKPIIKKYVRDVIDRNPSEEEMEKAFEIALNELDLE